MSFPIYLKPNPGPQDFLLSCPAEFLLYGGAAGGGKTWGELLCLGQDIDKPGYRALLLRRSLPEINKAVYPISRDKLHWDQAGKYNSREHSWTFRIPGGESVVDFGFLEKDSDLEKYAGTPYARIAFDESTSFSEYQIRTMIMRIRSSVPGIIRQCILGSNPVGPGFGFHKKIFIEDPELGKREPFKIYKDAVWPSDRRPILLSTAFIPASYYDNPVFMEEDPDYAKKIESQSEQAVRAFLEGSWDENLWLALDFDKYVHTIPAFPIPPYFSRVMGIDWGKRDKAVAVWLAGDNRFIYAYRDYATKGKDIRPFAYEVVNHCRQPDGSLEPIDFIVLSHECFSDRGMGQSQADQFREVFDQFGYVLVPSDRDPEGRLTLVREYLRTTNVPREGVPDVNDYNYWCARRETAKREAIKHNEDPWKAQQLVYQEMAAQQRGGFYEEDELPKMKIFQSSEGGKFGCRELIQTLPLLVTSVEEPRVITKGQDDHAYDALGHGLRGFILWGGAPGKNTEAYYQELTGGRVPDSGMAAEFAQREAQKLAGEDEDKPVLWKPERWKMPEPD